MSENSTDKLNLETYLEVEGLKYNVNAVHSDYAEHTDYTLTITEKGLSGDKNVVFDGSSAQKTSVVPSTGGVFSGAIKIPDVTIQSNTEDELAKATNLGSVKNLVKNLTGHPLAKWDGKNLVFEPDHEDGAALQKVSLIIGTSANFASFTKLGQVFYLYICTDNGDTYFGASAEFGYIQLCTRANLLLSDKHQYTADDIFNQFTSIENKFGASDAKFEEVDTKFKENDAEHKRLEGLINNNKTSIETNKKNISANTDEITKIKNGTTIVNKAENDSAGTNIRKNYYRGGSGSGNSSDNANTITISTSNPSGGNKGDIWIKYT